MLTPKPWHMTHLIFLKPFIHREDRRARFYLPCHEQLELWKLKQMISRVLSRGCIATLIKSKAYVCRIKPLWNETKKRFNSERTWVSFYSFYLTRDKDQKMIHISINRNSVLQPFLRQTSHLLWLHSLNLLNPKRSQVGKTASDLDKPCSLGTVV